MKKISLLIIYSQIYTMLTFQPVMAHSWPVFLAPDKQVLVDLNYIETIQCPNGQGRFARKMRINIRQYLCKNFCPPDWTWIGYGDGECKELSNFNIKSINIIHHADNAGTNFSTITVEYGAQDIQKPIVQFTMMTRADERWYCISADKKLPLFTCANDT